MGTRRPYFRKRYEAQKKDPKFVLKNRERASMAKMGYHVKKDVSHTGNDGRVYGRNYLDLIKAQGIVIKKDWWPQE